MLREARLSYDEGRIAEADALCRRYLRARPVDEQALHLMGQLYAARGDHIEAIRVLEQSLAYGPDNVFARADLAAACQRAGRVEATVEHLSHAISQRPDFFQAYAQLVNLYHELGRIEDAASVYRAWASRDPENAEVAHMAAATSGQGVPERCSVAYVQTHFDKLASSFDKRLVDDLGYTGHTLVVAALARHAPAGAPWESVLDAGCGTGLCGPLLRPYARRLMGLDLSEQMIEKARLRGAYDELWAEELSAFMRARPAELDAIASSDVMIYLGKLDEPFGAALHALKPGGLFAVTFEALLGPGEAAYQLQSNGRYAHREGYILGTFAEVGFDLLSLDRAPIRREFGHDVPGLVAVARKGAS